MISGNAGTQPDRRQKGGGVKHSIALFLRSTRAEFCLLKYGIATLLSAKPRRYRLCGRRLATCLPCDQLAWRGSCGLILGTTCSKTRAFPKLGWDFRKAGFRRWCQIRSCRKFSIYAMPGQAVNKIFTTAPVDPAICQREKSAPCNGPWTIPA